MWSYDFFLQTVLCPVKPVSKQQASQHKESSKIKLSSLSTLATTGFIVLFSLPLRTWLAPNQTDPAAAAANAFDGRSHFAGWAKKGRTDGGMDDEAPQIEVRIMRRAQLGLRHELKLVSFL
jgi:hypothetical protein